MSKSSLLFGFHITVPSFLLPIIETKGAKNRAWKIAAVEPPTKTQIPMGFNARM